MSDLTVNAATRIALLALQSAADARLDAARRLESGKRVGRFDDDPAAYFQAQALSGRIADIDATGRRIGQALSAVETGLVGLEAAEDLARQLRGLALAAEGASGEQLQSISRQFDLVRGQLDALAADVSYAGVSLVGDPADALSVTVGDSSGATVGLDGQAASAAALGIGTAIGTYNGFATESDISAVVAAVDGAVDILRGVASRLGSGVALLTIRESFSADLSATLQAEAFLTAARLLHAFQDGGRRGVAYVRALRFAHSLWSIVRADLSRPGNAAPKDLKQQVLSLSLFVEREIARAVIDPGRARIAALVEVNRDMATGLRPPPSSP